MPMYNEEENVRPVLDEVFQHVGENFTSYEVIVIDDGSADGTARELEAYQAQNPRLRVIRLRKNFGQTAAMTAGFESAEGEIIVTLDGDRQNHPKDIPTLISRMHETGADIVSGWRKNRKDNIVRRFPSMIANWLISRVTGVRLNDYGCTLKAYKRHIIKETHLYGELHRFIPAIASQNGANVEELVVTHRARTHGVSKYGLNRTLKVMLDLLTVKFLLSFGTRPIHVFGTLGVGSLGIGILITIYLAFVRLILVRPIADRPLLLLGVLLILVGLQFLSIGLIGELLVRIYHEGGKKKTWAGDELPPKTAPADHLKVVPHGQTANSHEQRERDDVETPRTT